jgi:Na+/melibiose symporter-like transporter
LAGIKKAAANAFARISSGVLLKLMAALQRSAGPLEGAGHRLFGRVKDLRHLPGVESQHVAQDQHGPLAGRQQLQRGHEGQRDGFPGFEPWEYIFVLNVPIGAAALLPLRLFRLKTLTGSNAVGFLLGASFFSFFFTGTLYMQQVLGYSALKTGVAWLAASVTALALAGPAQVLVTRVSAKLVMAAGMTLVGAGILWATRIPAHGHYWADLAGPFFVIGAGAAFTFIPVSIGALAGVGERDAGIASGLLNTSQQIGGAIGVAVASTVAVTHSRLLLSQGHGEAAALTGGFQWAFWVTGLTGLAAVPVTFLLIRRTELARAAVASRQREPSVAAAD